MPKPVKINNPFRAPISEGYLPIATGGAGAFGTTKANDVRSSWGHLLLLGVVGSKHTRPTGLIAVWLVFLLVLTMTNMIFNTDDSDEQINEGPVYGGLSTTGGLLRECADDSC